MDLFICGSGSNIVQQQSDIMVNLRWQNTLRPRAKQQFININAYLQARRKSLSPSERLPVTSMSDPNGTDQVPQVAEKGISGQHLVSGIFRRSDGNRWFWHSTFENEDIQRLDEVQQIGEYEWHPLNFSGGPNSVKSPMVEDANVVLFRNVMDWSRSDGYAWGQLIVWSGNFENCQRILQLLEDNSSTPNSVKLVCESYDLDPRLRDQYVTHHRNHPVIAAIAALYCCENVDISQELARTGDGDSDRLSCAICVEVFSTKKPGIKLRCNHPFHRNCIFQWFLRQISCPLCRDELK